MFKKFMISAAILAVIVAASTVAYADPNEVNSKKDEVPGYGLIKYLDAAKTFEKEQLISGRAREGTIISITHQWFKSADEKAIVAKKRTTDKSKEEGEWVTVDSDEWTVGASGIFVKPLTLRMGKNRIIIRVRDRQGNRRTETLEWELVDKSSLNELVNSIILKNLDKK